MSTSGIFWAAGGLVGLALLTGQSVFTFWAFGILGMAIGILAERSNPPETTYRYRSRGLPSGLHEVIDLWADGDGDGEKEVVCATETFEAARDICWALNDAETRKELALR